MRKRRSTVFVRPGKDVTLYVPAQTPPEVIDYLNYLKQEGMFSQGVMDIVTQYVQQRRIAPAPVDSEHLPGVSDVNPGHADDSPYPSEQAGVVDPMSGPPNHDEPVNQKLDVGQIFLQAQRNSGKMNDPNG